MLVMKKVAPSATVNLLRKVAAPRPPKICWPTAAAPPKPEPMPPPLPDWSKITTTITKLTITWMTSNKVCMIVSNRQRLDFFAFVLYLSAGPDRAACAREVFAAPKAESSYRSNEPNASDETYE